MTRIEKIRKIKERDRDKIKLKVTILPEKTQTPKITSRNLLRNL